MLSSRLLAQVAVPVLLALRANAETHLIKFVNQCGYGTPTLMYNGKNVLTGDTYTSNGPFSGIAYLQTGGCNLNGENCTLLETTLINPTCAGCGSSTDISLIPPHKYSVETSFAYYDAPHCDGKGKMCSTPSCTNAAFFAPNDNFVQVGCQDNDANLLVAFCADAAQLVTGNSTSGDSPPPSSMPMSSGSHSMEPSTPGSMPPSVGDAPPLP
ncbi:hypothetical protein L210DRAFT_3454566 [Boletus edulis BED1]|uniref:Glycopeptide n=1 Tax=Boletus edulis BED1 TaxID=1328754 RepID=A0AAD4GBF9_BOLED|nr:hypothetical protein L210DRAFT_3454566 [Boletus edulis BED1]